MKLYPYYKLKAKPTERKKTDCEGVEFIEGFNKHTQTLDWFYNSPPTLLEMQDPPLTNGKPLIIPSDIRNQLATLLLTFLGNNLSQPETV